MLHLSRSVNGAIPWANLHLLFWLSLIPFGAGWISGAIYVAVALAWIVPDRRIEAVLRAAR
jgi:uncharacterized membrane protein